MDGLLSKNLLSLASIEGLTIGKKWASGNANIDFGDSSVNIVGIGFRPTQAFIRITNATGLSVYLASGVLASGDLLSLNNMFIRVNYDEIDWQWFLELQSLTFNDTGCSFILKCGNTGDGRRYNLESGTVHYVLLG